MDPKNNAETFRFLSTRYPRLAAIDVLLELNGIEAKHLAGPRKFSASSVWNTLNGHRRDPRVMAAISHELGIPARELFGGSIVEARRRAA